MDPLVSSGLSAAVMAIVFGYKVRSWILNRLKEGEEYALTITKEGGGSQVFPLNSNGDIVQPEQDNRNY